jgi:hypothetical protein
VGRVPLRGRCWYSNVGARVVSMRNIFILNEIWVQDKIYILVALCLVEILDSSLMLVQVLAPNCKEHCNLGTNVMFLETTTFVPLIHV